MQHERRRLRRKLGDAFERIDLVLAASGLIGVLLYLLVIPGELPERAARRHIPRAEAAAATLSFAEKSGGLQLGDADAETQISKNPNLLDSLEEQYGRAAAADRIVEDSIPAFVWETKWNQTKGGDTETVASASVTLDGRPFAFRAEAGSIPDRHYESEALADLFSGETNLDSARSLVDSLAAADSAFVNRFMFRLDVDAREGSLRREAAAGRRIFLDQKDAARLARYHLLHTALSAVRPDADSVRSTSKEGRLTATVYFSSIDTTLGRRFTAAVEILPAGTLVGLEPTFVRAAEEDDGVDAESIVKLLGPLMIVVLSILLLVIFFRRLNAKLIDGKMALRDGLVFGVAAGITVFGSMVQDMDTRAPLQLSLSLIGLLIAGGGAAVFIFFISGAVNSIARDVWHEKLQTLDLLRHGVIRNVPVGRALVRGVLGGLTLVAFLGVVLVVFPDVRLDADSTTAFFGTSYPGLPFALEVLGLSFLAFFIALAMVAGVATLARRKSPRPLVVLGVLAVTMCLLQISPLDLRPIWFDFPISAILGLLLGWIFWRFDLITSFVAVFFWILLWTFSDGLAVPGSPEALHAMMSLALAAGIGILGFVGAASGKTSTDVPEIVPEYIEELAQRERLNREFELAREVQLSFLPLTNPTVEGVDFASICLPATEVGGDYYDFFRMPGGRIGVVVGDVSGKGMRAAFYMTLMKGILQSIVQRETDPSDILTWANELFRMNAPRGTFMSMIFGVLDPAARVFTFARAGHNPILVKRSAVADPEVVQPKGAALGLAPESIFHGNIEDVSVTLAAGDVLVIFTDGVTEAMNSARELFDDERLIEIVGRTGDLTAQMILDTIVHDVERFRGSAPRHDDMTIVVIRVDGAVA